MADVSTILDDALGPICSIILITGAGGMFGGVLRAQRHRRGAERLPLGSRDVADPPGLHHRHAAAGRAGLGDRRADHDGRPARCPAAAEAALSDFQLALLVIAIAAGATVLSHVNDSGFWLVSRFFGMDEKTTLKTWTVMETTLGLTAFVFSLVLWTVA